MLGFQLYLNKNKIASVSRYIHISKIARNEKCILIYTKRFEIEKLCLHKLKVK